MQDQGRLSGRREAVFLAFYRRAKANRPAPRIREICAEVGLTKASVFWHLRQLVARGVLDRHQPGRTQTYSLNPAEQRAAAVAAFEEWWAKRHPNTTHPEMAPLHTESLHVWLASRGMD